MSRDVTARFGTDWPKRRGGGGRPRGGGHAGVENGTGLDIPEDAHLLLEPSVTPTTLSSKMEHNVLNALRSVETKLGACIITPVPIILTETHEVLSQSPVVSTENSTEERSYTACVRNATNVVL